MFLHLTDQFLIDEIAMCFWMDQGQVGHIKIILYLRSNFINLKTTSQVQENNSNGKLQKLTNF